MKILIEKYIPLKAMFVLIIFQGFSLGLAFAQSNVTTSGGEVVSDKGTVSFSVGQVVYKTYAATDGSVSQSLQQPYEIYLVSSIEHPAYINLSIRAYPNPANDYLLLNIDNFEISNLNYQLYNMNGDLLEKNVIIGNESKINLSGYTSAVYFIKVSKNNQVIKEFKIIKN